MDIVKINEIEKHFSSPVATSKKKETELTSRAKRFNIFVLSRIATIRIKNQIKF